MEIIELFEYSRSVRSRFASALSKMPLDLVEKNREASYYSMKNILLHMIDNEDWIVNYAILGKTKEYRRRKWEEYTDMQMVLEHLHDVEERTRQYLSRANETELKRRVNFELSSGSTFDLSIEECLFQSFTEQLYHMGELIALFWQQSLEPPQMQWFHNNPRSKKIET